MAKERREENGEYLARSGREEICGRGHGLEVSWGGGVEEKGRAKGVMDDCRVLEKEKDVRIFFGSSLGYSRLCLYVRPGGERESLWNYVYLHRQWAHGSIVVYIA